MLLSAWVKGSKIWLIWSRVNIVIWVPLPWWGLLIMGLLIFLGAWTQHCTAQPRAALDEFERAQGMRETLPLRSRDYRLYRRAG